MLKFQKLGGQVDIIRDYLQNSSIEFCDISLGVKFMWQDEYLIEYAIYNDTLILKESCKSHKNAFYFPMGKDIDGALLQIENYCKTNNIPLLFGYIDNAGKEFLKNRYFDLEVYSDRDWCDYIYNAQEFKAFVGKKYSGQRNHINKFKKLYPNFVFRKIEEKDIAPVIKFLHLYKRQNQAVDSTAKKEQKKVINYVKNAFIIGQFGGLIEIDGKIVGVSFGEIVNSTLIIHVEKALKQYSGIYPTLANLFAKEFAGDSIEFINREEDCGDEGLRTSKLQYHPVEIKQKNFIKVNTLFDKIPKRFFIKTKRLTITQVLKKDKDGYEKLYLDDQNNKYFGYDYREDLGLNTPDKEYFYLFQKKLKDKKEEFSLAVHLSDGVKGGAGTYIGEVVLHNLDYFGGIEIGFRFLPQYQKKGYAYESVSAVKDYIYNAIGAKVVKSRCMKQNIPSYNLISKCGGIITHQTDTHYFFNLQK